MDITRLDSLIDKEVARIERIRFPTDRELFQAARLKSLGVSCLAATAFAFCASLTLKRIQTLGAAVAVAPAHFDQTLHSVVLVLVSVCGVAFGASLWGRASRMVDLASKGDLYIVESSCSKDHRLRPVVARWMAHRPRLRRRDADEFRTIHELLARREVVLEVRQHLERAHQDFAGSVLGTDSPNER